ncbi:WUSCHEL-related homeobox 11-like isoform X2 [Musa acuminata AAA Group]|uniref:WUSCHEL-related homeobox 11-like isoform X2 n=1 Tax=Musa acuminata AAA Group TaxID=214697 RepID=UPI0031E1EDAB
MYCGVVSQPPLHLHSLHWACSPHTHTLSLSLSFLPQQALAMDIEQTQDGKSSLNSGSNPDHAVVEPVRSRWTPKPEQVLILESIFNSGMVNPPKEETVRIRKLLEKFGAVADANVFYWFQNRRSRSRRRQRQLQAGLAADPGAAAAASCHFGTAVLQEPASSCSFVTSPSSSTGGFFPSSSYASSCSSSSYASFVGGDSVDDLFSISRHMGIAKSTQNPFECCSSDAPQLQYQPGTIMVFINGVLSEVPRGAFDLRAMFGHNVMLVHSSGELLPVNEYGFLMQSLQMGESYFLVSSPT